MPDYIIQKAVGPDKVVKKHRKTLAEYGAAYLAQRKYDGCCAVIFTGEGRVEPYGQSRTGEDYPSLDPAAKELRLTMGPGFVLIGEAWWPGKDQFNLISGEFRRLEPSSNLTVMVNDCLTQAEFDAGFSPVPYRERIDRVPVSPDYRWVKVASWAPGTYGCPQALCNKFVDEGGFDGLILRDPEGTWTKGSGTTGEIIKIKRVLSFDLRVTGWEPGKGKHEGRAGALTVDFRGKPLSIGTGLSDAQRDNIAAYYRDDWHGAIVEVEAMDYSSDGLLREPRFKGIRFDKPQPDA